MMCNKESMLNYIPAYPNTIVAALLMGSKESDKTELLTLSLSKRRMGCRSCALYVSWVSGP